MKDSALRLQDKTVLLVGPFGGITQAIARTMTEFGADLGFVSEHKYAGKYIDGINEAREVHPSYGRAAHYALPMGDDKQIGEALGRVAESLGRMDVLVDASPLSWDVSTNLDEAVRVCEQLAEKVMPFLLAKQRGRLVYLFEDECLDKLRETSMATARERLVSMVQSSGLKFRAQNVTVNAVAVGVTDDFILKIDPGSASVKRSFEELQKSHAGLKLVEYHDVGLGAAYLSSALSASVTGQVLRLTQGYHLA